MRQAHKIYRLFALAGVLGMVAWGCSTDSPTAPRQTPVPPEGTPGQAYNIAFTADPRGIAVPTSPTGGESVAMSVRVSPTPPDGTTMLLTTNIGQFDAISPIRSIAVALVNGRAYFTLFGGPSPVQLGVATVQGTLNAGRGEVKVPITLLEASFTTNNPENNESVDFQDTSVGSPQQFLWDFGDGKSSRLRNPVHSYPDGGVFSVKLTVSKMVAGVEVSDDVRQTVTVTVTPEP